MSERVRRARDAGMTLPELLITVSVLGLIATVLASAIVVTLRQVDNTEGRLNVARSEQSVDMYMPTDLASAESIDTSPEATPCPPEHNVCPGGIALNGSNALMLTWTTVTVGAGQTPVTVTTNVSYHFNETSTPGVYELRRIECTKEGVDGPWSCSVVRVLSDIRLLTVWGPNDPVPSSIIQVTDPLAPDAVTETDTADSTYRKEANRVIVTVNGGGDGSGAGGGANRISITAGGTNRTTIDADSVANAPTFVEARSRCGGPITLIVDDSGSIGGAMGTVEAGVELFVQTFAGTPTQIQVVRFDATAGVLGATGGAWTKYFDMTDQDQVDDLVDLVRPGLTADGGTNWEDAWFRTFYRKDGQDISQPSPELVVFFTDGEPTYERLRTRATGGGDIPGQPLPGPGWPTYDSGRYYSNGNEYSQVAFDRTKYIADIVRGSTKLIGVGVGGAFDDDSLWIEEPGRGWHWEYQRGFRQYQKAPRFYEERTYESRVDFQRATGFQSRRDYESKVDFETYRNGRWRDADAERYFSTAAGDRRIGDGTNREWDDVTAEQYWENYATLSNPDYWRDRGTRSWYTVTESLYDAHNVANESNPENDGWRINPNGWIEVAPSVYYANVGNPKWRTDGTRDWYPVSRADYEAYASQSPGNWRPDDWASITKEYYDSHNNPAASPADSDGYRVRIGSWVWINAAEYQANNVPSASPADSDGYRDMGKQYVNEDEDAMDWEPVGGNRTDGGYRRVKAYTAPFDQYDEAIEEWRSNEAILAELITGNHQGYSTWNGQVPGNAEAADLFVLPDFDDFADALQAVALAECGGTLTLSTKVATPSGEVRAADPFTYQNNKVVSSAGANLAAGTSVTTSATFPTGTFDFHVPPGSHYVTVDIMPQITSDQAGYHPGPWSCRAGNADIPPSQLVLLPLGDTGPLAGWNGMRVRVSANQAVSCTMTVSR